MTGSTNQSWQQAEKAPFVAFGILYYPLFKRHDDLAHVTLDDEDMTWAVTANANLEGTGYTLSQPSILTLASYHHAMAELASKSPFLPLANILKSGANPLADIQRFAPNVTASPMYPDFPTQVLEISEARFRYDQACHYFSTYGVEFIAGLLGLDVTVSEGWMPDVESTPKERLDEALIPPKVLHVLMTVEDLQSVVCERLTRATRMHPAEIDTTLLVFDGLGEDADQVDFPKIAFHENMMELIRVASASDSATLERVAVGLAQHPGDLLKATLYFVETNRCAHLSTRQKKGLCRAFEHFSVMSIAHNIADGDRQVRRAPNYLSVERFAGPRLREALELVRTGRVRSWTSLLEDKWTVVNKEKHRGSKSPVFRSACQELLAHYGQRPGMFFRAFARLLKAGCPIDMLQEEAKAHADAYALPTIVRTLSTLNKGAGSYRVVMRKYANMSVEYMPNDDQTKRVNEWLNMLLRELLNERLRSVDTPLKGRRVYLDTAGISLVGSALLPNSVGNTDTAWPPIGIAYDLPVDKTVRFFTFWDDRETRVDVDLHFVGRMVDGSDVHIGWNSSFRLHGMVTSGDKTTSIDSVEYLDARMAEGRAAGVDFVVQLQHIFCGRKNWKDIHTCYSGALVVDDTAPDVALYNPENLLFRDDLTGKGRAMAYAVVNFPQHYVRILRGADLPLGNAGLSLDAYLKALFRAQEVKLVDDPDKAELQVCVGRSEDPSVISLFDEGFYIG